MTLKTGLYEATGIVNIRREPRIVENKVGGKINSNQVGQIGAGTQRQVYSLSSNQKGETWGRVSEADGAGIAEWICIQNLNRVFMKPVETLSGGLEARVAKLEAWARGQGFEA